MNPYTILSSGAAGHEAAALCARLSAWHDAMVTHERRLRSAVASDACDDQCARAEARALWPEAIATFGARALGLAFLRSRAQDPGRGERPAGATQGRRRAAEGVIRHTVDAGSDLAKGALAFAPAAARRHAT